MIHSQVRYFLGEAIFRAEKNCPVGNQRSETKWTLWEPKKLGISSDRSTPYSNNWASTWTSCFFVRMHIFISIWYQFANAMSCKFVNKMAKISDDCSRCVVVPGGALFPGHGEQGILGTVGDIGSKIHGFSTDASPVLGDLLMEFPASYLRLGMLRVKISEITYYVCSVVYPSGRWPKRIDFCQTLHVAGCEKLLLAIVIPYLLGESQWVAMV